MIERLRISDFMAGRVDRMAARLDFISARLTTVAPSP
jgi:hypothetical protein